MAITLYGGSGLFDRVGAIGGILEDINTYRGTTIPGKVDTLAGLYAADLPLISGLYPRHAAWQGSAGALLPYLRELASSTIITMVNADVNQPDLSLATALRELIRQMEDNSESVEASASLGLAPTPGASNIGDGVAVTSTYLRSGRLAENMIAETVRVQATNARQLSLRGEFATPDPLNWAWPEGSACATTATVIRPQDYATNGGNLLTNGDFENFTVANTPDNWTIAVGSAGTTVYSTNTAYAGTKALQLTGNGSELTTLRQTISQTLLAGREQYAASFFIRVSSAPSTGVLRVALVDGSNTVIDDDAGAPNSFTVDLTMLTGTYINASGVFRLPSILPATVKLELALTTAVETAKEVYLDHLAMGRMAQLYPQGPAVAFFRGPVDFVAGDTFALAATITPGGFQRLFDRLFSMRALALLLPSSGTPTVSDSLIA